MELAVEDYLASERDGTEHGPSREAETRVLEVLETMYCTGKSC